MGRGIGRWVVVLALAGCGSKAGGVLDGATAPDADTDLGVVFPDAPADVPPLMGRRAFDVVATLTAKPTGGGAAVAPLPRTNQFTLVLDADQGRVLIGGGGDAADAPFTRDSTGTYRAQAGFNVKLDGLPPCMSFTAILYTSVSFFFDGSGSTLSGVAEGKAGYASGDVLYQIAFTATLAGTPDATPPGVLLDGTATVDPVALPLFRVTEPAAETSKARLVTSGAPPLAVDLVSRVANGVYMPVVGFERPTVVLRYGATYHIDASGVADFAGLSGAATDLTFDTPPAPPLAAEDGFEAAAGTSLGGAAVVRDGPLPPIAGTTSLYIGSVGAPWSMRYQPGRALTLRLPVLAGDKKLRFSYRTVASYDTGFEVPPTAVVGVVDGTMTTGTTFSDGGHRTKIGPVENGTAYLGDVQTAEMAVPPGAPTEVVFELAMPVTCRPLRPAGLLIDDVRVE